MPNSGWLVQTDGNGDGRADVLLLSKSVSATAALSLLTQDTSGQLSETAVLSLPDSILDDFFRFQTWGTPSLLAATAGGFEFRVSEFDQSGSTAGVLKRASLNGDLSWSVETLIRQPGLPNTMLAADFDGDGQKDELFLGSELPETSGNTDLHIFLRNPPGSGLSAVKQKISFADPSGPTPGRAVAMNLNNDGIADIVHTIPENSAIGIRLSIEPGVYAETQQIPVGVDPDDLVSADFNGDGREDLAVSVSGENRIALYLTQPDGSLLRQTDLLTAAEPRGMAAVNIAGDASADLVVAEPGASRVSIYGGLNNGSFVSALQIPLDSPAERVAIGDVNADGFPDIIAACSLDDSLRIVRGQLGGFAAAVRQPLPGSPTAIAAVITSDGNTVDLYAGLAEVPNIASARTVRLSGDSNGTFGDPQ
ncbi:MAG: FG-GAP repeat domain-containing protein, partial [Planctomyces sp.]